MLPQGTSLHVTVENANCTEIIDYFDGVFNYLNTMLMEEEDLANKPCMFIDSLALQATEASFYNVLVDSNCHSDESERMKEYDTALLCEELTRLWLHKPCTVFARVIVSANVKKKRRKGVVEMVDLPELLIRCGEKMASNDTPEAIQILKTIRKHSSPNGNSSKRMAHYFANAIEARLGGGGLKLYQASTNTSAAQILRSYKAYIKACPFHRMSNVLANKSIGKLAHDRDKIHIIDFGILYGFQWPCIIQGLSLRPGGPPQLQITGIDFPQPGPRPAERVEDTGCRLIEYAKRFNVNIKYKSIAKNWEDVCIEDLEIDHEEMLVVNSMYRMRNVLDETVMESRPRDAVLGFIRKLNPDVFVHGVLNGTYNVNYFDTRFKEAVFHFTTLFDMLEATAAPGEDLNRELYEREVYGRDIINVVACEGKSRVERPEPYRSWGTRNMKAGFVQMALDSDLVDEVITKVENKYHKDFMVYQDKNWMLQGWKGKVLYALSLWKPAT
ncbi:scarecrow-like protein 14 [Rutidosis leptorrhynchoides]|uniref:scarecrow-like protein 14 n=1 Tax=Rutidosis leptorrhynchoides TaxID=125765 RepID=UPI003A9A11B5